MMRLLIIAGFAESIVPFRGALIEELKKAGCEVHIAAPGVKSLAQIGSKLGLSPDRIHEVPMSRAGTNPWSDLKSLFSLYQLMRAIRPDVVLPYTIKPVVYGILAACLAHVPRRYALVTGLGYAFSDDRTGAALRIVRFLYGLALARATKVFFQNPDDDQLLREIGILPSEVSSVVVNGSGVDVSAFAVVPLPPPPLSFLMIARLLGDKGVREYAESARRIRMTNPDIVFRLVGWVDENPDTVSQVELDGWIDSGHIEFLGKLSDVRPAIANSTVYVLPSYYREGTPRTVLEALAMGRPVITTNAPGCRETVVDGENGFLVPIKSTDALVLAMKKFINEPMLATRMGERSRQIAEEKYDVRKVNAVMLREMGISAS